MKKTFAFAAVALALAGAFAWAAAKPTTIRIVGEDVVAHIEFEKGGRLALTSKPVSVRPDTYWTKSLSLVKKDDKARAWELRGTDNFGGLANVTVDAEQDKILLLGKDLALVVDGKPAEDPAGSGNMVIAVTVVVRGMNSEGYLPWAFDGKGFTLPMAAVKDADGKVLASGRCVVRDGRYGWFAWRYPAGWKGPFDVEVQAFLGPFEAKMAKTITPFEVK